jgi:hypothetical protein
MTARLRNQTLSSEKWRKFEEKHKIKILYSANFNLKVLDTVVMPTSVGILPCNLMKFKWISTRLFLIKLCLKTHTLVFIENNLFLDSSYCISLDVFYREQEAARCDQRPGGAAAEGELRPQGEHVLQVGLQRLI